MRMFGLESNVKNAEVGSAIERNIMNTDEVYIDMKKITPDIIDVQIRVREDLLSQMVGNLYPLILSNEISKLRLMKSDFITENEMKL